MHDIAINDLTRRIGLLGILVLAVVAILMVEFEATRFKRRLSSGYEPLPEMSGAERSMPAA